jgi:hypothetical protein
METGGLLPCYHKPSPVPIMSQIDPIHTIPSYLSKIHFNIVHQSTSWSSQWALSFWFPPISYMHSSSSPVVLHALPMSSSLTWSFKLCLEESTSYEGPHYLIFSNLMSLHLSSVRIFSTPCSQTPSVCVPPLMSKTKFHTHTEPQVNPKLGSLKMYHISNIRERQ